MQSRATSWRIGVLRLFDVVRELLQENGIRAKLESMYARNYADISPRFIHEDAWVDVEFDWLDDDLALVGTRTQVKGLLTATDILRRLTDYTQGFVYIESIEYHLRALFAKLLRIGVVGRARSDRLVMICSRWLSRWVFA